jgi:hypothetical protein
MLRDFLVSGDTFSLAITRADTTLGANLNFADFKVTLMTESQQKSFPVSWEELHRTSKALAWRLLELGPFEGIVAGHSRRAGAGRHCGAGTGNPVDRNGVHFFISRQ